MSKKFVQMNKNEFIEKYPFTNEENRKNIRNIEYVPGEEVNVRVEPDGSWTLFDETGILDEDHEVRIQFFEFLGVCEAEATKRALLSSKYVYTFIVTPHSTWGYWPHAKVVLKYMYEVGVDETTVQMKDGEMVTTTKTVLNYHPQQDMAYDLEQVSPQIWDYISGTCDLSLIHISEPTRPY